jgi:DNA mismatch endonuclease, patch repair protein
MNAHGRRRAVRFRLRAGGGLGSIAACRTRCRRRERIGFDLPFSQDPAGGTARYPFPRLFVGSGAGVVELRGDLLPPVGLVARGGPRASSARYLPMVSRRARQGGARVRAGLTLSQIQTDPARSALMARVRQKGTSAELAVRQIVGRLGYRFSTNASGLPGTPDIVNQRRRLVVFVHGCFWHRHMGCRASTTPKRNTSFWNEKFAQNVARDRKNARQLRRLGYTVLTVWECQIMSPSKLARLELRLRRFFARS